MLKKLQISFESFPRPFWLILAGVISACIGVIILNEYNNVFIPFPNVVPLILGVSPAFFIWLWRDQNKRADIKNAGDQISLQDFHQIQKWAAGEDANETLQIAAIHQLKDYLIGNKGERFIRPTWELLRSLLNTWDPKMVNDESDPTASFYSNKPNQKLNISKHIEAVHTVIREESERMLIYYQNGIDFMSLNLNYAWLSRINLSGANLTKAKLNQSDLGYAKLKKSNLVKTDLSYANLCQAELANANMTEACLKNAKLTGANCKEANLSKSTLLNADLRSANFEGVNLTKANLSGAHIWETNFMNSKWIDGKSMVVGSKIVDGKLILHFDNGEHKEVYEAINKYCLNPDKNLDD